MREYTNKNRIMYNKSNKPKRKSIGRKKMNQSKKIRVGILDDHSITLSGYKSHINSVEGIEVEWTAQYFNHVDYNLKKFKTDILILDASVPTSEENTKVYPIFNAIPEILEVHPDLSIIIISMHNRKAFVRNVLRVGASGYIVKDDSKSLNDLGNILKNIGKGGIYFSPEVHEILAAPVEDRLNLTARQVELLSYWATNLEKTAKDVAQYFGIANSTLRNHLSEIYIRLEVNKLAGAIEKAKSLGIITPEVHYPN
jgi:DNA-binding NarL/FixJ family response regulator